MAHSAHVILPMVCGNLIQGTAYDFGFMIKNLLSANIQGMEIHFKRGAGCCFFTRSFGFDDCDIRFRYDLYHFPHFRTRVGQYCFEETTLDYP